jgi:hypothetical protein
MKRFDIYNVFKDNLTFKFLESSNIPEETDISKIVKPVDLPSEITIPNKKRKIPDLGETEY